MSVAHGFQQSLLEKRGRQNHLLIVHGLDRGERDLELTRILDIDDKRRVPTCLTAPMPSRPSPVKTINPGSIFHLPMSRSNVDVYRHPMANWAIRKT